MQDSRRGSNAKVQGRMGRHDARTGRRGCAHPGLAFPCSLAQRAIFKHILCTAISVEGLRGAIPAQPSDSTMHIPPVPYTCHGCHPSRDMACREAHLGTRSPSPSQGPVADPDLLGEAGYLTWIIGQAARCTCPLGTAVRLQDLEVQFSSRAPLEQRPYRVIGKVAGTAARRGHGDLPRPPSAVRSWHSSGITAVRSMSNLARTPPVTRHGGCFCRW
jgi:hypothetical protein